MGIGSTLKAIGDPTRRGILDLLKAGSMTAGDIAAHFDVAAATVSHHLSVLRSAGLITDEKVGKNIYYELNMTVIDELLSWAVALKGGKEE